MSPRSSLTIIELAGTGPAPFASVLLTDMGANIIRIDRARGDEPGLRLPYRLNIMNRGRRSVAVNLKSKACPLSTTPSPRDRNRPRMPASS